MLANFSFILGFKVNWKLDHRSLNCKLYYIDRSHSFHIRKDHITCRRIYYSVLIYYIFFTIYVHCTYFFISFFFCSTHKDFYIFSIDTVLLLSIIVMSSILFCCFPSLYMWSYLFVKITLSFCKIKQFDVKQRLLHSWQNEFIILVNGYTFSVTFRLELALLLLFVYLITGYKIRL